jgi:hypothetical protein
MHTHAHTHTHTHTQDGEDEENDASMCSQRSVRTNSSSKDSDSQHMERVLRHLTQFLRCFSLQTMQDSLTHCIDVTVRVLVLSPANIQGAAHQCVVAAMGTNHGPLEQGAENVLKFMLPWLVDPNSPSGPCIPALLMRLQFMCISL